MSALQTYHARQAVACLNMSSFAFTTFQLDVVMVHLYSAIGGLIRTAETVNALLNEK